MNDIAQPTDAQEYEALLQFLYMAPVGLVQLAADGTILMLNPLSAQLLMPLSRDGELTNLFDALAPVAPDLRLLCGQFSAPAAKSATPPGCICMPTARAAVPRSCR